jgi:hypothetical protein
MVDVGVGQEYGINLGRTEWKSAIVKRLQRLRPLKQSAVHQQAPGLGLKKNAGAGHGSRSSAESKGHAHDVLSGRPAPLISLRNGVASVHVVGLENDDPRRDFSVGG